MAENKTKPTKVSVDSHIAGIQDAPQRADAKTLVKIMEIVSGEKAKMWGTAIVGFGSYHYVYESGREGDAPLIGFSARKGVNVLYSAIGFPGADALLEKLGRHTTGKGCLYIKSLADINDNILKAMLSKSLTAKREKKPTTT